MNVSVLTRSRYGALAAVRRIESPSDLLQLGLAACATLAVAAFLVAAAFRLGYPFPFESTEPASLEEMLRVLRGQPLYVAPTLQHVPMIYGPVYFYLAAALARLLGASYLPLRLLSLAATAGSMALIADLVHRETGRWIGALAAVGLLAITYPLSDTAFDTARVDALFVFLLLAAAAVVRFRQDVPGLIAGGILVGISGLTKLPIGAAPVALALAAYLVFRVRVRAVVFIIASVLTVSVVLLALRLQAGPWPTWYMLNLPSLHAINNHGDLLWRFWLLDVLPRFTLPLLIGPAFLLLRLVDGDRTPLLFYGALGLSFIGVAWAARSNSGGDPNVLLPAFAIVAILFGLGVDGVLRLVASGTARMRALQAYVLALCIGELALNAYNPRLLVPYRSEQWAAERLSSALAGMDGPVFGLNLDGYTQGTAKGEQPLTGALLELTGSYGGPGTDVGRQWQADFRQALAERRFSQVVVVEDCCGIRDAVLASGYQLAGPLFPPGDDYWLWTNGRTPGSIEVYVPPNP